MFRNPELVPVKRPTLTGGTDRYGKPVTVLVTLPEPVRCGVADAASDITYSPGRVEVDYDYALYLDPGQTVQVSDVLVVRGRECKVVRPQFAWVHPNTGRNTGDVVYVKAVAG